MGSKIILVLCFSFLFFINSSAKQGFGESVVFARVHAPLAEIEISMMRDSFCAQNEGRHKADHASLAFGILKQEIPDSLLAYIEHLRALCGQAFEGRVIQAPEGDTTFSGKRLVMEVRYCEENLIGIPFHVDENRSRTWLLTIEGNRLLLKHDHRHEDGSDDDLTMYGGISNNPGLSTRQTFPADDETYAMIPEASSNVWMMEIVPGKSFTYMLHRLGTGRLFMIEFDITKPIENPPAPWGWD